jgi:predicted O-linked N-acetylglucosamine transferase (SPINDLY family)
MNGTPENEPATAARERALEEGRQALRDAEWAEKEGLPERAIDAYRKVAASFPDHFQIHNNLANLLLGLGRVDEALDAARKAFALQPGDALVNANLGQALLRQGQVEEAIPCLRRALAANPALHLLRKALAETLLDIGRRDEALATFTEAEHRFAGDQAFLAMMAAFCHRARAGMPAERCFLRLKQLAPRRAATYNDLAQLYIDFAQFSKAKEIALQGLQLEPDAAVLWNTLANAQASLGLVKNALAAFRKVLEIAPKLAAAHSNMLLTMHYSSDVGAGDMAEEHRKWGRQHAPPELAHTTFTNAADPGRRLRIAYISPDIRRHSVAFFLEPLLDHRDCGAFEVFCYGDVKTPDEVTQRLKAKCDQYCSILGLPDQQVAEAIRADGVDILIDLAGHAGSMRAAVLGYKPAPVVVTYCGYPDTTGIEAVDYRITDWLSDPAGVEPHYTETLVRLPDGFHCFGVPEDLPEIGDPPCLSGRGITFGSFNREFKVSQDTYDLWCRILRAVPGSRMIMKSVAGGDPATREYQLGEFERRGIARDRVQLIGFIASQKQHLAGYREVDIALDTFPYHGTTTTLDALLMGVPVLTLEGYNHASRVGVSLLSQVGLEDLVAHGADEYVARAIELATDTAKLRELHRTLRGRLLASPLCDGPGFARKFEYALRGMWARWCRSQGAALSAEQAAMAAFDFAPLSKS